MNKLSGSGRYNYEEANRAGFKVIVTNYPERLLEYKITFFEKGDDMGCIRLDNIQVELLWSCLKRMADQEKWED